MTTVPIYLEDHFYPEVNEFISSNYQRLYKRFRDYNYEFIYLPSISISLEEREYYAPSDPTSLSIPTTAEYLESLRCNSISGTLPALVVSSGHRWDRNVFRGLSIEPSDPEETFQKFLELVVVSSMPKLHFNLLRNNEVAENVKKEESLSRKKKKKETRNRNILYYRRLDGFDREKDEEHELGLPLPESSEVDLRCEAEPELETTLDESVCSCPSMDWKAEKEEELESTGTPLKITPEMEDLSPEDQETILHIIEMVKSLRSHRVPQSILSNLVIPEEKLSRLVVTKNFRILLPDYNKEIEMVTIDKVLYLLLLRHPEGILQKCMTDYVGEMKQIYLKMKDGFLTDRSRCAIENMAFEGALVDQKLSRIRLAFNSVINKKLARNYIPISGRAVPRRIPLEQNLVEWEEPLT